MYEFRYTGEELWARMERAVERVNERLRKTVQILEHANVPYAIVGGHAVRAWVAQVDEAAVRTTRDVDILIRPDDFPLLKEAMTKAGFHHRQTADLHFLSRIPRRLLATRFTLCLLVKWFVKTITKRTPISCPMPEPMIFVRSRWKL